MQPNFAPQRKVMDEMSAKLATYGRLSYPDQMKARATIESMFDTMKTQISSIPADDYIANKQFLRSLIYATTKTGLGG